MLYILPAVAVVGRTGPSPNQADQEQSNPRKFFPYRETALRTLRTSNYPRTNQFEVQSQLEGLEEKFRVYNEDPLADALKERLDELAKTETKWTPEILHLLLELSDKPASKSRLTNLELLKEPEPDTGPVLKWKDLAAEDPLLREKSVWKNVDFGAESSDDEIFEDSQTDFSGFTEVTDQSSVDEDYNRRLEEYPLDILAKDNLELLRKSQFWKKIPSVNGVKLETIKKPITELQAIREILFMLSGFPTWLFDSENDFVRPSSDFLLKHASCDAFQKVLQALAEQGSAIMTLRAWVKRPRSTPLLQVLENAISQRIITLDDHLSGLQQSLVASTGNVVVSLLGIQNQVSSYTPT